MPELKVNQIKLESLMDAVAKLNGAFNPDSDLYSIKNPLKVKSFARPGKHQITEDGLRVFPSILAGMKAGLFDLELKIKGQSRAGLKTTDSLSSLLGLYGVQSKQAVDSVVSFLRRAMKDQSIKASTELSYFIEQPICTENVQMEGYSSNGSY